MQASWPAGDNLGQSGGALASRQIRSALPLYISSQLRTELITYREKVRSDWHSHEDYLISVMLAGNAVECDDTGSHQLTAKSCSVYPPGHRHSDCYGEGGSVCVVYIASGRNAPHLDRSFGRIRRSVIALEDSTLNAFLRNAWNASTKPCADYAGRLLDHLIETALKGAHSSIPEWISQVHSKLLDLERPTSIKAIAGDVGRNHCHLVRAFKQHYGLTPTELRIRARVSAGMNCMLAGEGISGAAAFSGFADASHFARNVRRFLGAPPSVIRARSMLEPKGQ